MSRLDYVTIAIVAVCVAALVYLIYMTTNLLGDSGEPETTTETTTPSTDSEDTGDDTYYFDEEGRVEDNETQANAGSAGANEGSNYDYQNGEDLDKGRSSSTTTTASPEEMDTRSSGIAEDELASRGGTATSTPRASSSGSSTGLYMVMAGTFTVRAYAQDMENKLRGMGYNSVELEPFDRGKYTVVIVDRFSSISDAKSLVSELKNKNVDSYVKKK